MIIAVCKMCLLWKQF